MPGTWTWVAVGLVAAALAGWIAVLAGRGRWPSGGGARLVGMLALLVAGGAAGYSAGPGPAPVRMVVGALLGYLVAHTAGWLFDRLRRRRLHGTGLARDEPAAAREYRLRTVLLPGATATGVVTGIAGAGGGVGFLVLVALVVLRREFVGAPLVALVLAVIVVVVPLWVLRARALRDVRLRVGDDRIELGHHTGAGWRWLDVDMSDIRAVTVFADPYGKGRLLRVDAGDAGAFELRAAPGLTGRAAADALRRASRDVLGRPGWRPASGVRPYRSRWGTRRYRSVPARDNR